MNLKEILKNALPKTMTYDQYRNLVDELVQSEDTTGETKTEDYIGYTQLNSRRMRRWDKTLKLDQGQLDEIQAFNEEVIWLVLTESWCGDAAPSIPAMAKIASLNPGITMKVLLRDEHPELMDRFLTAGARTLWRSWENGAPGQVKLLLWWRLLNRNMGNSPRNSGKNCRTGIIKTKGKAPCKSWFNYLL